MALSNSTLVQNKVPNDPDMKDLLDLFKKDIFVSMNCHAIATVQSFDSDAQTVSATINYKKTFFNLNSETGLYNPVLVDYPVLVDVPIIALGGGKASLTMPIQQGDECLILFNDRDMSNWFEGNPVKGVATSRLHSFADGIAIVGLRSLANVIENYDSARAVLRNDQAKVAVGPNLIEISNQVTTLKNVVDGLIDVIKALVTVGSATTQTISSTSQAALETYKSTVGGLLS